MERPSRAPDVRKVVVACGLSFSWCYHEQNPSRSELLWHLDEHLQVIEWSVLRRAQPFTCPANSLRPDRSIRWSGIKRAGRVAPVSFTHVAEQLARAATSSNYEWGVFGDHNDSATLCPWPMTSRSGHLLPSVFQAENEFVIWNWHHNLMTRPFPIWFSTLPLRVRETGRYNADRA